MFIAGWRKDWNLSVIDTAKHIWKAGNVIEITHGVALTLFICR